MQEKLGQNSYNALPGSHAITDCDYKLAFYRGDKNRPYNCNKLWSIHKCPPKRKMIWPPAIHHTFTLSWKSSMLWRISELKKEMYNSRITQWENAIDIIGILSANTRSTRTNVKNTSRKHHARNITAKSTKLFVITRNRTRKRGRYSVPIINLGAKLVNWGPSEERLKMIVRRTGDMETEPPFPYLYSPSWGSQICKS